MSRIPGVHVRSNPRELSPKERLARFQREIQEADSDERLRLLREYLDPNAPVRLGVTIGDQKSVEQVPWHYSTTAPSQPGDPVEVRDHQVRVLGDPWAESRKPPKVRTPLERAESMTRRYVAEWRRGNTGMLESLLREICGEYWKAGQPITEDALRMLARKSLEEAEMRMRRKGKWRS